MFLCWIYSASRGRAVADRRRGDAQLEPIGGVSFPDWPPFTGCWHQCYIKVTSLTAAPDKSQHWHSWEQGEMRWSLATLAICITRKWEHFFAEARWNSQLFYSLLSSVRPACCWLCGLYLYSAPAVIVCFCSELERYLQKNKCNVELDRTAEVCFSRIVIFFTLSLKASSFQRTNSSLKDTFKHRRLDFFFF